LVLVDAAQSRDKFPARSANDRSWLSLPRTRQGQPKKYITYRAELAKICPRGGSAGRVRKVPPGEPARYTAPSRGRSRVSPAAATARSLQRRRDALFAVHLCYIALCAKSRLFHFLSYYDKQPKHINFRALAKKKQLKNLESKVTISFFRRDMASFDSRILS